MESDLIASYNDYKEFYTLHKIQYRRGVKHGKEVWYYSLDEVKGLCIKANFRIKTECEWRKGMKHGKVKEYSQQGILINTSRFKKNKLVR